MAPTVIDQIATRAYSRWVHSTMAAPEPRDRYRHFRARVTGLQDVAESVRRVTLAGLADYLPNGADEYLGLFLPPVGRGLVLPDENDLRVHAALAKVPEPDRPGLRWYTVRARRGDEIDIDIVRHGDAGPGTAWAGRVAVGEEVGVRQGSAAYRPPSPGERQLLVADETALPALAAIIDLARQETEHDWAGVRAVAEIPGPAQATPLPTAPFPVRVVTRTGVPGSGVLPLVEAVGPGAVDSAWVCGEAAAVAAARRHLVRRAEVNRRRIFFSGYWKLGRARG